MMMKFQFGLAKREVDGYACKADGDTIGTAACPSTTQYLIHTLHRRRRRHETRQFRRIYGAS